MKQVLPELPHGGWRRVVSWTLCVTVFVTISSVVGAYYGAEWLNGGATWGDVAVALFLAIALTVPIAGILFFKVEELRLANDKLKVYAATDHLTGALSRGAFTAEIERLLSTPTGNGPSIGSLLVIDVDRFKRINDSYGHQQGDLALRLIAAAIRANVRGFDRVGRLGGEEFGVFLVEAAPEYAFAVAERIRNAITQLDFAPDTDATPLSVSVGIASADETPHFAELYRQADTHLYTAKNAGRNKVVMADLGDPPPPKPVPRPMSSVA